MYYALLYKKIKKGCETCHGNVPNFKPLIEPMREIFYAKRKKESTRYVDKNYTTTIQYRYQLISIQFYQNDMCVQVAKNM